MVLKYVKNALATETLPWIMLGELAYPLSNSGQITDDHGVIERHAHARYRRSDRSVKKLVSTAGEPDGKSADSARRMGRQTSTNVFE